MTGPVPPPEIHWRDVDATVDGFTWGTTVPARREVDQVGILAHPVELTTETRARLLGDPTAGPEGDTVPNLDDTLAAIDAVAVHTCGACDRALDDGVSDYFCDDVCQARWHAQRAERLTGYREPYDLPWRGTDAYNSAPRHGWAEAGVHHGFDTAQPDRPSAAAQTYLGHTVAWVVPHDEIWREPFQRPRTRGPSITHDLRDVEVVIHEEPDEGEMLGWILGQRFAPPVPRLRRGVELAWVEHVRQVAAIHAGDTVRALVSHGGVDHVAEFVAAGDAQEIWPRRLRVPVEHVRLSIVQPGEPLPRGGSVPRPHTNHGCDPEPLSPGGWLVDHGGHYEVYNRWRESVRQAIQDHHALQATADLNPAVNALAVGLAGAFDGLAEAMRPLADALGLPPDDETPQARALRLRQQRNTGPRRERRPPRRIDARRGR